MSDRPLANVPKREKHARAVTPGGRGGETVELTVRMGLGLPLLDDIEYPHARLVHDSALNSAPEHAKGGETGLRL